MTANDWILPWFMLVRIMYIMLNISPYHGAESRFSTWGWCGAVKCTPPDSLINSSLLTLLGRFKSATIRPFFRS